MLVSEVGRPVPGLYRVRLAKSAPWSAVKIWDSADREPETGELLEDEYFHMLLNGREVDPFRYAERVNCWGERIEPDEYEYILSVNRWAADHAPSAPEAKPNEGVDMNAAPPIF